MPVPEIWLKSAIEEATDLLAYPLVVPEGAALPWIVYGRNATQRDLVLGGVSNVPMGTFDVAVYADSYADAKGYADEIRAAVNNFNGTVGDLTIEAVMLTDERDGDPVFFDGRDVPTYAVQQTYTIRWQE